VSITTEAYNCLQMNLISVRFPVSHSLQWRLSCLCRRLYVAELSGRPWVCACLFPLTFNLLYKWIYCKRNWS